ncbi:hypothetical protein CHLNCDRAFT_140331 [Chlorella variabilis]|uniref:Uncharacterized protein n=1 Tax=Chlorella variabilis TaxID=554065 RepID=E1Z6S7_CHLVA|nr:hypothetical protein CHLNCDRAFT_140331 [Chlorella variabilis]EFN58401.1 hypothetical protein CHLNCDRAFT_140331 [Chlorella variabilis]|eukprot:XP_005850503.1 hypothetical protein CHLNCDRAFT_140331 [Chlorella variabilis]
MLADAEGLTATNRRMMPTVGCEADAIAYTQAACKLFQSSTDTGAATVAPDGSYSQGPHDISAADCTKAALEQCLVVEPRRRRLRVVHNLRRTGGEGRWVLDSVEVHNERYDSPYRGKVELSGCGGGMKAFAGDQRLAAEAVQGSWEASGVRYSVDGDASGQCSREAVSGEGWSAEDVVATGLLLHPLQAWSACDIRGEDVTVTAGVLLDEGGSSMAVATRRLVAGRLVAAELLTLTRKAA